MHLDALEKLPLKLHIYTNHACNFKALKLSISGLLLFHEHRGLLCGDAVEAWGAMGPGKLGPDSASIKTYNLGSSRTPRKFASFPDLCNREACDTLGQRILHSSPVFTF